MLKYKFDFFSHKNNKSQKNKRRERERKKMANLVTLVFVLAFHRVTDIVQNVPLSAVV